ncbi:MAG TPA: hypothetical protein VGP08_01530 [Pyrinomonadaceae bacterium]|jgi:hypothetical protein|nr:hypothetical protein [Pyrinomonadaceae bacterium]
MLLSELAIIYLAAAAPFGVARFFKDQTENTRAPRRLLKATAVALAWPLSAPRMLLARRHAARVEGDADDAHAHAERRVELVKRSAVNSLREVEDLLVELCGDARPREEERHALFAARECVERYAGLSLACASADEDEAPTERELELCRIAGRAGDDLLTAGRCVHRRSVTRLLAHRERARSELIHSLAGACEVTHDFRASAGGVNSKARAGGDARVQISEAMLRALARAIELMSLFDDRGAVVSAARLLDAECARAGRLDRGAAHAQPGAKEGAEQCTTRAAHTAFATQPPRTMTSH